ncbi:hypothetical protein BXZ70DRAFT_390601 [Cristinia sonorae]|uniref:Uncharacterized protein n=1 Tax=Cristinia sonorae TaxID=1940300 RepID=A0A8K0UKS6_9AGAR|nr:hypothetical protein BXZ70DRAFT_390601 [Cristinia sonorae]
MGAIPNPTYTSTSFSERKSSEFARLFDFFSRLASGDRDLYVPREFENLVDVLPASPASSITPVPRLCRSPDSITTTATVDTTTSTNATLFSEEGDTETTQNNMEPYRGQGSEDENKTTPPPAPMPMPMPRGRRTSIAVVRGRGAAAHLARRFPLGNGTNHAFTFKMMIHELYDINDFASMVQEVLAKSQQQFRPLPEALKRALKSSRKTEEQDDGDSQDEEERRVSKMGKLLRGEKTVVRGSGQGVASAGKFPKNLGLGRPSGLDVPAAERALKKRRVGRRRSVSGGPMEKEPEWIDAATVPNIDATIDEGSPARAIPAPSTPTSAAGARSSMRTRKSSASGGRSRASTVTRKPAAVPPMPVREAAVVKYAETFLNVPVSTPAKRPIYKKQFERARSEEPDFGMGPMSAPSTQNRFKFGALDEVVAKTVGAKRRLSFST